MVIGDKVTGNKNIKIYFYMYLLQYNRVTMERFSSIKIYMRKVHIGSGMEIQTQGKKE